MQSLFCDGILIIAFYVLIPTICFTNLAKEVACAELVHFDAVEIEADGPDVAAADADVFPGNYRIQVVVSA